MCITYKSLAQKFFFVGLQKWTREKVAECPRCNQDRTFVKTKAKRVPLQSIPITPKLFWRVHVDLAGPFSESCEGHVYIGVAVDAFSKFVEVEGKSSLSVF